MIHGENFRVYEVAACGGVCFLTYKPDLVSAFEPGVEIVLYEDGIDLKLKIDYYLRRPDELDAIDAAARRRVLSEYTYDHRAQKILQCIQSDHRKKR